MNAVERGEQVTDVRVSGGPVGIVQLQAFRALWAGRGGEAGPLSHDACRRRPNVRGDEESAADSGLPTLQFSPMLASVRANMQGTAGVGKSMYLLYLRHQFEKYRKKVLSAGGELPDDFPIPFVVPLNTDASRLALFGDPARGQ